MRIPGRSLVCVLALVLSASSALAQQALTPDAGVYKYEVATIKPNNTGNGSWRLEFTVNGLTATGVPMRKLIAEAYATYDKERLVGLPAWGESEMFDIEAKFDTIAIPNYKDLSLDQRRLMLRALLAERFKLVLHREMRDIDAFALVVGKNGPKFSESAPEEIAEGEIKGYDGYVTKSQRGQLDITGVSMKGFAGMLRYLVGRYVVDKTGLPGRYDLSLRWTPDDSSGAAPSAATSDDPAGPSIFTALQEQLGLKLQLGKFPVETLVVDKMEHPSVN
jgi:uncharacterized protein (TIGR03435 family)